MSFILPLFTAETDVPLIWH